MLSSRTIRRLRKATLVIQMVSLSFFVAGMIPQALACRCCLELCRLPWFVEQGVKDQIVISVIVLVVSTGGIIWRLVN